MRVVGFLLQILITGTIAKKMAQSLESSSSSSILSGSATSDDIFWLEAIKHQGKAAYNPDLSYQVFRNVKDFGARGDGVTDDTEAIKITPAVVYFPSGTYLVSKAIIAYYYTQFIGNPKNRPTLLATPTFTDMAVIDADPYIPNGNGAQWYTNQNNLYGLPFVLCYRNLIIDTTLVPPTAYGTGIHWQVAQATSLMNIEFRMSDAPNTAHQGIFMENGSGGFMGDLVFNGGKFGMWVGNQQFTVRNITINKAQTAIMGVWAWGWTFQGVIINDCAVGFDLTGKQSSTPRFPIPPIFIRTVAPSNNSLPVTSLVLKNIKLNNVSTAVDVVGGQKVLPGAPSASTAIKSWVQGNVYTGSNSKGTFIQQNIADPAIPDSLLNEGGQIFGRMHPQYADYHVSQFVSVRDHGATGDGKTDDTEAIKSIFSQYGTSNIIFFDAGTYIVTSTITIPAGARVVGEAWSVISGKGPAFQDQNNPQVVVRVGEPGSRGIVEITDIIFSTVGPAPGAVVVEWNIQETQQGSAGAWDTHIRLGGCTNLEIEQCKPGSAATGCMAAFMALHLTRDSTAYLEGMWVWLADHELDQDGVSKLTIFAGRGILSESQGPVWMLGAACKMQSRLDLDIGFTDVPRNLQLNISHFIIHNCSMRKNTILPYCKLRRRVTPYFQPYTVTLPYPFNKSSEYGDPDFPPDVTMAWALTVRSSTEIVVFGAGLYSFFSNYSQACLETRNCQNQIVNISSDSSVYIYSLATVSSTFQISADGKGVVNQTDNISGFTSTVTVWQPHD
ncbi:hypothetical protein MSAN_01274800 [Mycena sanguinolenta]|uniref:Rhamnogalacturonase A/B/Epimerase-like pectate lyase domain-containing protein n=1 Tax=Mycena sanguinolenta TaxID=230812 RepID=A0A8H6YHY8_9AGAR|nr:hypothetical protein MSAN_01274800 [Mycena sanguinolenta]